MSIAMNPDPSPGPEKPKFGFRQLAVPFIGMVLMVDAILVIVMGISIFTTAGEGVVAARLFKYQGSPSIQFKSGEIIPVIGAFYSIENGDYVKKERGSFIYEINGRRVNAWFLYTLDLVRFTLPAAIALMLVMMFNEWLFRRMKLGRAKTV